MIKTGSDRNNSKMVANILENSSKAKKKAMVRWKCKMDPNTKVIGLKTKSTEKVNTFGLMADILRVSGRIASFKVMAFTNGQMESVMPAIIPMT